MFWLSENDCTCEEKKRMKRSFDFDSFTVEDLLTDVKKSGLFSVEEIDRRVLEICRRNDKEMKDQKHDLRLLLQEMEKLKKGLMSTVR